MSLDYPERKEWLGVRRTPRDLWKYIVKVIWNKGTWNRGRNKAKRAQRLAK